MATELQAHQLSIEQLSGLRQQHEDEINELNRQLESLQQAKQRFITSRTTLDEISSSGNGDTVLVPLNNSLYVPGKISNPQKVMVELGTGYYCEKDINGAKELIDRKMQLISKSMESVETMGNNKRKTLEQLMQIMQYKMQSLGGGSK